MGNILETIQMSQLNYTLQDGFKEFISDARGSFISFVHDGGRRQWNMSLKTLYGYTARRRDFIIEMLTTMSVMKHQDIDRILRRISFDSDDLQTIFEDSLARAYAQNTIDPLQILEKFGEECSICSDKMDELTNISIAHCGHMYHKNCIDRWISTSHGHNCPMCRNRNIFRSLNSKQIASVEQFLRNVNRLNGSKHPSIIPTKKRSLNVLHI